MKNLPIVLCVDQDEHRLSTFKSKFCDVMHVYTASNCAEAGELLDRHEVQVMISAAARSEMPGGVSLQESVKLRPRPIRILLGQENETREFIYLPGLNYPVRCLIPPYSESQLIEAVFEASYQYQSINNNDAEPAGDSDYLDRIISRLEEVVRAKRELIRALIDQG